MKGQFETGADVMVFAPSWDGRQLQLGGALRTSVATLRNWRAQPLRSYPTSTSSWWDNRRAGSYAKTGKCALDAFSVNVGS